MNNDSKLPISLNLKQVNPLPDSIKSTLIFVWKNLA